MRVVIASEADIPAWLALASEVEGLFGAPLSRDEGFVNALKHNVQRGSAFCVREDDGPPGSPLLGGLLFSMTNRPVYVLGWMAVAERSRRMGVGHLLLTHAEKMIERPAELVVTTFLEGKPGGEPARYFYKKEGFHPAEFLVEKSPLGAVRQRYRKQIN